jgi:predicted nucleotidyltransferase
LTTLQDILSSRVKAEIFRVLFGIEHPELHLRELVRRCRLSLGTVQQELRHLTSIDVLISRKDGNRLYYRANSAHPLYPELSSLVIKTDGLVGLLETVMTDKQIMIAFVFGSVARSEIRVESDIDLMIIGTIGLRRVTQLLSGLSLKVGREINPHVLSPKEFGERKKRNDHFLTSVLASPKLFVKGIESELATMGQ